MAPKRQIPRRLPTAPPPPPVVEDDEDDGPRPLGWQQAGQPAQQIGPRPIPAGFAYMQGDEYEPARGSPQRIANIQIALVEAGLLKAGKFQLGVWGETSIGAYKDLLVMANAAQVTAGTMLHRIRRTQEAWGDTTDTGSGGGGGGGGSRAPLQMRVTNADDLRSAFRQVAYQKLGGKFMSDEQIDLMVSLYQEKERDVQRALYGGAGEVETMPDPATFAEAGVKFADSQGERATRMASYGDLLMQMMGGGS